MRSNGSNSSLSQWDHASSPGDVPRLFPGRGGKKARKYDVVRTHVFYLFNPDPFAY